MIMLNAVINRQVIFQSLGLIDYEEAWDYQTRLFEGIIDTKLANRNKEDEEATNNYLLFCEHPHVYTLGKSGDKSNLLLNEQDLKSRNATFYKINRGGDITYHGPGQLVGYPILDLENFFTDIHKYMRSLEEAIILTLREYSIEADRFEGLTGVWLEPNTSKARKICAIGVKSSRWVTMHGFALNVSPDLEYFNNIIPCGIEDKAVTSISMELGRPVSVDEVGIVLRQKLSEVFEMEIL